ncbi:MAG: hypothetical protein IKQ61_09020 [Spirochaetales bacterium]|nr:hypothetical protein [Spirochaetales bacterium]
MLLINIAVCSILQAQTRIAVLQFTDDKISKSAMAYLTEIFTVEMVNSRKFTVVERARLDAALKEMQIQNGDMFDENTAVELGKMAGAEMVFLGSILRFGRREMLSIKGMDIQTATLKYAKQEPGGSDAKLEVAVKKIADFIIKDVDGTPTTEKKTLKNEPAPKKVEKEPEPEPQPKQREEPVYQPERQTTYQVEERPARQQERQRPAYVQKEKPVREPRQPAPPKPKIVKPPKDNTYKGDRELTIDEEKVLNKYIQGKWGIDANSKNDMTYYYKQQLGAGIALAIVGPILLVSGAVVTGVLCSNNQIEHREYYADSSGRIDYKVTGYEINIPNVLIGSTVGGTLMITGLIITACCAYPFVLAQRIAMIYAKTSGYKLTFLERTNFNCCYNWENKEFTVGMTIKI